MTNEQRILDAAQFCFAEEGYANTSLPAVAARASVALEVLYQHFRSKRTLFLAASDHAETFVCHHLRSAASTQPTFAAGVEAALDEVCRLSREAPLVVRFFGTVGAELARIAELRAARSDRWPNCRAFVTELLETGEANGELASADRLMAADTLTALFEGLLQVGSLLPFTQSGAAEGYKRLITGTLLQGVPHPRQGGVRDPEENNDARTEREIPAPG